MVMWHAARSSSVRRWMADVFMNARMYAVTSEIEAGWRSLLQHIAAESGVALTYLSYPAPQPLEDLWRRDDMGCALMCGYPIAMKLAAVVPIAAPIPRAEWAAGRALYRTDLIVRRDSDYRSLADTFGGRAGWTVEHSQSGFNAFRHHLLGFRTTERPALYQEMVGNLVTARNVLDSVREGRIDIGPLDAYWHLLMARHAPHLTDGIRVLTSTATAPIPAFVSSARATADERDRLSRAFVDAASRPWFGPLGDLLLLDGFAAATQEQFAVTLAWDRAAKAAGYHLPA
jgi:ABC-type phosphate/phosphonate transport system substrate-binding protein